MHIKDWHRHLNYTAPLKVFARRLAHTTGEKLAEAAAEARRWLSAKGCRA